MVRRILVPVDASTLTERAIDASIALARQLDVGITAFVARPWLPSPTGLGASAPLDDNPEGLPESEARADVEGGAAGSGRRVAAGAGNRALEVAVDAAGRDAVEVAVDAAGRNAVEVAVDAAGRGAGQRAVGVAGGNAVEGAGRGAADGAGKGAGAGVDFDVGAGVDGGVDGVGEGRVLDPDAIDNDAITEAQARRVLARFEALARAAGVPFASHHDRVARSDRALVEAAESHGCDLVVMVTHGRGAFGEFLFGSQAKAVLAGSRLPLLVLR